MPYLVQSQSVDSETAPVLEGQVSDALTNAVAPLFLGDRMALNSSALASENPFPLPAKFPRVGRGTVGGFANSVGVYTVDNGGGGRLGGVMIDGAAKNE